MSNWYLIHTKIRQEHMALDHLERQGFECFLPLIRAEKLRRGALQVVQEPLFPRYLFIRLGTGLESQSWAPIRSTTGVSRLVSFGQVPAKIDDELVGELRAQSESSEVVLRHFEPGEQVVVTDGPFIGVEAIYQMPDAEGRVIVLLNILSKQVKMTVLPASIRKFN
ncbi:transcription/translation regulatory transformer protein RfaH [Limnohabitans sp. 63ED37-2]|uniref:transcription/translation regulatory transformer protein RfaH n=1 Tax=Limnohabitans sp. 63ED37-2 TaxID=1678128 RepID=UPI000706885C|nr:transcription/translation regulatory transformer protein RfaH [Limnohabitans sp. 63ED37-2]ALK87373.1 Transcription antitermination protein RfaH [Limnohabitans sp. 63ED37-2]